MADAVKSLIGKIRASREFDIEVEGRKFKCTRPTAADAARMQGLNDVEICQRFVCGWDLKELDIIPGGGSLEAPFDKDLFAVWIEDQPRYWGGLAGAILNAFLEHRKTQQESEKN